MLIEKSQRGVAMAIVNFGFYPLPWKTHTQIHTWAVALILDRIMHVITYMPFMCFSCVNPISIQTRDNIHWETVAMLLFSLATVVI